MCVLTVTTPIDYRTLRPSCGDGSASASPDTVDVSVAFDDQFTIAAFGATVQSAVSAITKRRLCVTSLTTVAAPHDIVARSGPQYTDPLVVGRELLDAAAALAAQLCIFPAPAVVANADAAEQEFLSYSDAINETHRLLVALAEPAAAAGVIVAVRAPSGGCLLSPVEVRELVDSIHSPHIAVCIDMRALQHIGRLEDWVRILQHHVVSVRGPLAALDACAKCLAANHDSCILIDECGGTDGPMAMSSL